MSSIALKQINRRYLSEKYFFRDYMFGRNAIFAAFEQCKLWGRKKVIFPSYSCGDEIAAAIKLGLNIDFYNIKKDMSIDLDSLARKISETDIVVITHFFGLIDKNDNLLEILTSFKARGGIVIEDAAYAFFSQDVGVYGDFIIFSLRKGLPLPHGAILASKTAIDRSIKDVPVPKALVDIDMENFASYKKGKIKLGSGVHSGIDSNDPHGERYKGYGGYRLGASREINAAAQLIDFKEYMVNTSKRFSVIYASLTNRLDQKQMWLASKLVDGQITSKIMPIVVADSSSIYKQLIDNQANFSVPFWNKLHPFLEWDEYQDAAFLKNNIIAISLDQNPNGFDIAKFCDIIISNK